MAVSSSHVDFDTEAEVNLRPLIHLKHWTIHLISVFFPPVARCMSVFSFSLIVIQMSALRLGGCWFDDQPGQTNGFRNGPTASLFGTGIWR